MCRPAHALENRSIATGFLGIYIQNTQTDIHRKDEHQYGRKSQPDPMPLS